MRHRLVILKNENIEVGVLPRVGGRVVSLRLPEGENVLFSDKEQWEEEEEKIPALNSFETFKAYNGHIVWVGPQEEWWNQQNITEYHGNVWPPDPYLIYGDFQIAAKTESYMKLVGPESEISGVQLVKEISLSDDGGVHFKVTAENIRSLDVSWDLWSNTRCFGLAPSYAPVGSRDFRIDQPDQGGIPYEVINGWFAFKPSKDIPEGKKQMVSKLFTHIEPGVIAAFTEGGCFLKQTEPVDEKKVHPKQAFCEIYNQVNPGKNELLLELELHGEYRTLKPGETMSFEETWSVLPYTGVNKPEAHIDFLEKVKNN